jgi:ADP-heptose:LPS heptosyltransferase
VLLSAPAVALLRASLPDAEITYLVGSWGKEAAEHGPTVDRVRSLDFPGFTRHANANVLAPYVLLAQEATRLRRARFDLAVILRPDHWWGALLVAAAGVPLRVGGDTPETRPLLTHCRAAPSAHWAAQALDIAHLALEAARTVPVSSEMPAFRVSDAARGQAERLWRTHALDGKRVVALQPSAGAPLKRWPPDNWRALADALEQLGCTVIFTGAPSDIDLLVSIGTPRPTLAGQSLDVTAALFERCALLIGLDGGAAHLAGAVGTPTIRLYGPASDSVYGPWPPDRIDQHVVRTRRLDCVPCGALEHPPCGARTLPACLLAIEVDDILELARRELRRG